MVRRSCNDRALGTCGGLHVVEGIVGLPDGACRPPVVCLSVRQVAGQIQRAHLGIVVLLIAGDARHWLTPVCNLATVCKGRAPDVKLEKLRVG